MDSSPLKPLVTDNLDQHDLRAEVKRLNEIMQVIFKGKFNTPLDSHIEGYDMLSELHFSEGMAGNQYQRNQLATKPLSDDVFNLCQLNRMEHKLSKLLMTPIEELQQSSQENATFLT